MKSIVRFLSIAATAVLALGSCSKDKVDYIDPNGTHTDNIGYLSLSGMTATVLEDTDNVESTTRAEGVDINNFDVVITNAQGEKVESFKYGERPTEPIVLEGGVYTLSMSSADMVAAEWESPIFGAEKEVIITRKQTTEVKDIVCKMQNIKVSVAYSADLKDQLNPEFTKMTVELGESKLEYAFAEERAGFFAPLAQENTLKLTFNCRYVDGDKDIIMTNEIKGVKAAQWRKINVVVQHAADGTATIGIVCDTWTYDEEVTFDSSAMLMEEVIPDDTDAPVIVWEGHDLNEPFELTDDMFDAEGNFKSSINLDITAKAEINSVVVKVASDNPDFMTAYSEIMPLHSDICDGTVSNALLRMMGYPTDAKGATATRIKLAAQAEMLCTYKGTHTYEITVTDVNGGKSVATVTLKYGEAGPVAAPSIVWTGYNIDERQTYALGMTCDLVISAPGVIDDFVVEIISNDLTDSELQGVGLAAKFSLVNDSKFFAALGELGFPVGDAVKGKKELNLSITNFLAILSGFSGDHDFKMTVKDSAGAETTKSIMLHFNYLSFW